MAIEVEDGTGKQSAVAYIDVAYADAYFEARGLRADWDAVGANKESAIVRATDALDRLYEFVGTRKTKAQALQWPRAGAKDLDGFAYDDEVPDAVKRACAELALKIGQGIDPLPDLERGGRVQSVSAGDVSVTFEAGAPAGTVFQSLDRILRGLVVSPGSHRLTLMTPAEKTPAFSMGMHDMIGENGETL